MRQNANAEMCIALAYIHGRHTSNPYCNVNIGRSPAPTANCVSMRCVLAVHSYSIDAWKGLNGATRNPFNRQVRPSPNPGLPLMFFQSYFNILGRNS